MSAASLSQELAELGQPILDTGISKIEKGTRAVDVDDLVAVAVALGVTPNALLLPEVDLPGIATSFMLTPQREQGNPADLWAWATGEQPLGRPSASESDDEATRNSEVEFTFQNRPHRYGPARSYMRELLHELEKDSGSAANDARSSAARIVTAAVLDAFVSGLSSGEIRNVAESAIAAALIVPSDRLAERAAAVAARDRAAAESAPADSESDEGR